MDTNQYRNIVRIGKISSVNGAKCRARVTFPDKENVVSDELPILQIGASDTAGYWVPEVGTNVLCLFLPNPSGHGLSAGFILGAFYTDAMPPKETDESVREIKFKDGSFIRYDNGEIAINAASHIKLTAPTIDIN